MSLFEKILHDDESFIKDFEVLEFSYMPKNLLYREKEQNEIAYAIKPLFNKTNGSNILIHGVQGIGKTIACKRVLEELEDYDEVESIYINCWQYNTEFKIFSYINDQLGNITSSNKVEDLQKKAISSLNKSSVVIILDEFDKLENFDIIYTFLEQLYRKSILLITNFKDIVNKIDPRITSRLNLKELEFRPYNEFEVKGILLERIKFAFYRPNAFDKDSFDKVVATTLESKDMRKGLVLIRECALQAENDAKRKIDIDVVNNVIKTMLNRANPSINKSDELSLDQQLLLDVVKEQSQKIKIGYLFELYQNKGGAKSYKSVQRAIDRLYKGKFIDIEKSITAEGNTTFIQLKKL